MEGFLRYRFGGLIFGGAYTWRGLFSEFYGNCFILEAISRWYFDFLIDKNGDQEVIAMFTS